LCGTFGKHFSGFEFFCSQAESTPAHTQVTQTVRQFLAKWWFIKFGVMLLAFPGFRLGQTQADRVKLAEEVILIGSSYIGLQTLKNHCGACKSDYVSDSFSIKMEVPNDQNGKEAF
jgi:hypothetical protein